MNEIFNDTENLLSKANRLVQSVGIDQDDLVQADMICYRVETNQRYEVVKQSLARSATLLDESEISGRLISIFELAEPIAADGWRVSFVELPQPKPNNRYSEGWEHVQFVTRIGIGRFLTKYPEVEFEVGGAPLNKLLEVSGDGATVKFHDKSIGAVLELEANK